MALTNSKLDKLSPAVENATSVMHLDVQAALTTASQRSKPATRSSSQTPTLRRLMRRRVQTPSLLQTLVQQRLS